MARLLFSFLSCIAPRRTRCRENYAKNRAMRLIRVDRNTAPIHLNSPLGDREPEPHTAMLTRAVFIEPEKSIEHSLSLRRRDPRSLISNPQYAVSVRRSHPHIDDR